MCIRFPRCLNLYFHLCTVVHTYRRYSSIDLLTSLNGNHNTTNPISTINKYNTPQLRSKIPYYPPQNPHKPGPIMPQIRSYHVVPRLPWTNLHLSPPLLYTTASMHTYPTGQRRNHDPNATMAREKRPKASPELHRSSPTTTRKPTPQVDPS